MPAYDKSESLVPEDDFMQLVSSNPLTDIARWLYSAIKSRKITYRGLADSALSEAGISQAPVIFLDFAVPCKSSSMISPFSVCHLLEFLGWEEWVIPHSNFFMIFSYPHMAGLAVQYSYSCYYVKSFLFPLSINYLFMQEFCIAVAM